MEYAQTKAKFLKLTQLPVRQRIVYKMLTGRSCFDREHVRSAQAPSVLSDEIISLLRVLIHPAYTT